MRYMVFVRVGDDVRLDPEQVKGMPAATDAWVAEMDGRGVRLLGNALVGPDEAKAVRVRDGHTLVVDGPFADTKEHIAGFDLIDCDDLDEALEVAAKHPVATFGTLEVRAFAA